MRLPVQYAPPPASVSQVVSDKSKINPLDGDGDEVKSVSMENGMGGRGRPQIIMVTMRPYRSINRRAERTNNTNPVVVRLHRHRRRRPRRQRPRDVAWPCFGIHAANGHAIGAAPAIYVTIARWTCGCLRQINEGFGGW